MWACDPALTSEIIGSYHGVGPLFAQALAGILAAQCALVGDHLWPSDATQSVLEDPNYDFIIVGAGSAGSVLANRLSEISEWKVLLIEAGGDPTLATETPQYFLNNIASSADWGYITQPQEGSCRSHKMKGCTWPRGKVLGGSSSINGMYYVRGNKLDYDEWAAAGNKGWSYEDVLPYFKKSQNFSEPLTEELKKYHSNEGYLSTDYSEDVHDLEMLLIKAATELGMKHLYDINGDNQMGITKSPTTIKDGVRHSTARAFLTPIINRKNLHVIKNALVSKVLFKPHSNIVSGVIISKDGKNTPVNAKKEVILSAGTINTPQLLMLSGIGPRIHLEKLDIEVKADLPVGENLQDHVYVPIYYKLQGDITLTSLPNLVGAFAQYILEKKGPLVNTAPHRVISFLNTTDGDASTPDVEFHYIFFPPRSYNAVDVYDIHGANEEYQRKFREINEDHFVLLVASIVLRPKSKGKIILKTTNPHEHPLIFSNYFEDSEDLQTIFRAVKQHALKIGETETFKGVGFQLQWLELDACKKYDKKTDDFLKCWSRETSNTLYHPTSSVKMGPVSDDTTVVDSELRVKKIKNLRVIDASIMPTIIRGNTNAATIMIAEKGADMMKKYWLNKHTEL